jgi:hypothetical protein
VCVFERSQQTEINEKKRKIASQTEFIGTQEAQIASLIAKNDQLLSMVNSRIDSASRMLYAPPAPTAKAAVVYPSLSTLPPSLNAHASFLPLSRPLHDAGESDKSLLCSDWLVKIAVRSTFASLLFALAYCIDMVSTWDTPQNFVHTVRRRPDQRCRLLPRRCLRSRQTGTQVFLSNQCSLIEDRRRH